MCVAVTTACHFKLASSNQDCVCDFVKELPDFHIDLFFTEREEEEHPGRFLSVTDNDIDKLTEGKENTNTKRERRWNFGQNKPQWKENFHSKAPGLWSSCQPGCSDNGA